MKRRIRRALKAASTAGIIGAMSWQVHETSGELRAEREAEVLRAEAAQESLDMLPGIAADISLLAIEKQSEYVDEYNSIPSGCVPYVLGHAESVSDIVGCGLSEEQRQRIANRLEDLEEQQAELDAYFDDTLFYSLGYHRAKALGSIDDVSSNSVFTDLFDFGSSSYVTGFDSETGQLVYGPEVSDFDANLQQPYGVIVIGGLALLFMVPRRKRRPVDRAGEDSVEQERAEEADLLADGVGND